MSKDFRMSPVDMVMTIKKPTSEDIAFNALVTNMQNRMERYENMDVSSKGDVAVFKWSIGNAPLPNPLITEIKNHIGEAGNSLLCANLSEPIVAAIAMQFTINGIPVAITNVYEEHEPGFIPYGLCISPKTKGRDVRIIRNEIRTFLCENHLFRSSKNPGPIFGEKVTPQQAADANIPLLSMNDEKTAFKLSLPLGTKVYRFDTNCMNTCSRNVLTGRISDKNHMKHKDRLSHCIECSRDSNCHVLFTGITEEVLSLANLQEINDEWLIWWFPTRQKAREAAIHMIGARRAYMDTNGIPYGKNESRLKEYDYIYNIGTRES